MELSVEICELKLLEFGYYVLQVSAENATNNGTLQVNCVNSDTATNCGQVNLLFNQNYPSIVVKFLITEQGDFSTMLATGISTVLPENCNSKLFCIIVALKML